MSDIEENKAVEVAAQVVEQPAEGEEVFKGTSVIRFSRAPDFVAQHKKDKVVEAFDQI